MSIDVKYRTSATATGGRNGHVWTDDGTLDLSLSSPKELGGVGGPGANPEQLFASGYSACFLSALNHVGRQLKVPVSAEAKVTAQVGIGMGTDGGFGLVVDLIVSLPGLNEHDARLLVDTAHHTCPYSIATRGNIEVRLKIV